MTPGLYLYGDSHDTHRSNHDETVATLRRSGAVGFLPCIEANDGRRPPLDTLVALKEVCDANDVALLPFTFPSLLGDLVASRVWAEKVATTLGVKVQLDAEPAHIGKGVVHWRPATLEPWLDMECLGSITTTRAEAPHLGPHSLPVFAQLESQTSLDSLDHAMRIFGRYTDAEKITLVMGVFDQKGDPRTLSEVRADLHRATPQAIKSGMLAAWSAHSLSVAEADAYREFVVSTWGVKP